MIDQPINLPIGKNKYRLEEEYRYYFNDGMRIVVPENTVTDGASIPRFFNWFLRRDGLIRGAALIHDFIYSKGGINAVQRISDRYRWVYAKVDRKFADELFLSIMIKSGIPKWRAYVAYKAVRAFGWSNWGGK